MLFFNYYIHKMEDKNKSYMSTKLLEDHNNIYNRKEGKNPFILQFKQLKYYYNLRKKFKNALSGNNSQEDGKIGLNPKNIIAQNMYCLIDRKWLKKWKNHVGYKEIKNKINEHKIKRDLDNEDYKWISEIIDKNYRENYLILLDNNSIYKDNEINPLSDFKVIHKDCFKLFNINSENTLINNNFRKYPLRLFKDKYIVFLNNDIFLIVFKNINSHNFNEIIVDFRKDRENSEKDNKNQNEKIKVVNKKKIIEDCFNKDINEWLKEINFNFTEIMNELEYNNCKFKIYNKTLLRIVEEKKMKNELLNNNFNYNNNQILFRNNNKFMNNNYNNQKNNDFFNSNNEQNHMNQQNSLQSKLILMEQDKKNFENMKNKEINELKKKINELEDELKKEKDKNKLLEQNIINLDNLKKELNKEINKNKDLKKSIEMKNININELNQIIVEKEKKINILEKKLSRFPFELDKDEELMSVIFTTLDQKFHYSIICKNTDIFNTIENKLYSAFSEYSETENYFFVNGGKINKVKTLEYNKIKNNDLIILNQIGEI